MLTLACCNSTSPDHTNDTTATATEAVTSAESTPKRSRNSIVIGNHHKLIESVHGVYLINNKDTYIGKSLDLYGEWEQESILLLSKLVKPGQIVLDIGANIGSFTIPLSKLVGTEGEVHSYEAQRVVSQLLNANVAMNELNNVHVYNAAVGDNTNDINVPKIIYESEANYGAVSLVDTNWTTVGAVEKVSQVVLDQKYFIEGANCLSLMKIDVEGMELNVLRGASKIVKYCKPILHIENNCVKDSKDLISWISAQGYTCHWDIHPYFNQNNVVGNKQSVFQEMAYATNMICYHQEMTDVTSIEEFKNNITKIDVVNEKYLLSDYKLVLAGKENILLTQLGTIEKCER